MKKWEKPTIQNLTLNYTQEDGVDTLAFWNSPKYCSSCCAKYLPRENWDLGYYYEGDNTVESLPGPLVWLCGIKKKNGLPCLGILKNLEETPCS